MNFTSRSSSVIDSGRSSALSKSNSTLSVCESGQPTLSTRVPAGVPGHLSSASHTPSLSPSAHFSGGGGGGGGGGGSSATGSGNGFAAPRRKPIAMPYIHGSMLASP